MKLIDRIAYRNAIKLQEAHIMLCGYRDTEALRKTLDKSDNWILKTIFMLKDARSTFGEFREVMIERRYFLEKPYDFNGTSPVVYVAEQLVSRVWTAITIRRCRKEIG